MFFKLKQTWSYSLGVFVSVIDFCPGKGKRGSGKEKGKMEGNQVGEKRTTGEQQL